MGTVLQSRYELRYLIASGGMADVHAAFDREVQQSVAVKLLRPELAADRTANERLRREGEALAAVQSPHVVGLHDIGCEGDTVFLVLERIHGLTVEHEIRRFGPISPRRACGITLDILCGLDAIHASTLVHRDIKPANVMIDLDDRAVLVDLGIALHLRRRALTEPGFATGTPAYMAPEQLDDVPLDGRVDLYQLGMLLVYMTTGVDIDRESGHEALLRMPPALCDVALRALAPAGARYRSASVMAAAVANVMDRKLL